MIENILAVIVCRRAKQKFVWDSAHGKATNCSEAVRFIRKQYRQGWSINR
jgi:hypothetical protein